MSREGARAGGSGQDTSQIEDPNPGQGPVAVRAERLRRAIAHALHLDDGQRRQAAALGMIHPFLARAHHRPAQASLGDRVFEGERVPPSDRRGHGFLGRRVVALDFEQVEQAPLQVRESAVHQDEATVPCRVEVRNVPALREVAQVDALDALEREAEKRRGGGSHVDPHALRPARPELPAAGSDRSARRQGQGRGLADLEAGGEHGVGPADLHFGEVDIRCTG